MMKEPANRPVPVIDFHTGTPRSKSTDTTPIVFLPLTVIAKTSYFAFAVRSPGPPAVGARRWRSTHLWVPTPVSAIPKPRIQKFQTMDCARKSHIYSRRPRLMAVFLCEGPGGRVVPTSRRKARRINSEKVTSSRRALSSRSCWMSRGRRNVTGTLPFGSFVLGMKLCVLLYHTPVKIEFSCPVEFAVTRSAA
jgi:hypothetical protein